MAISGWENRRSLEIGDGFGAGAGRLLAGE
jgi:hypothetical protein